MQIMDFFMEKRNVKPSTTHRSWGNTDLKQHLLQFQSNLKHLSPQTQYGACQELVVGIAEFHYFKTLHEAACEIYKDKKKLIKIPNR